MRMRMHSPAAFYDFSFILAITRRFYSSEESPFLTESVYHPSNQSLLTLWLLITNLAFFLTQAWHFNQLRKDPSAGKGLSSGEALT